MSLSENRDAVSEESQKNHLNILHTAFADAVHTKTLPESAEWKRIIQAANGKNFADTIKKGRSAHIPEILIRRFAFDILMECIERQDYGAVARYLKGWNIGHSETQAYFEELAREQQKSNAKKEQKRQLEKTVKPRMRQRHYLILSPDATIADLVQELGSDKVADGVDDLLFVELADNISTDLGPKLTELMNTPEAATTKVMDFFGESLDDLMIDLPIKFRKN